VSTFTAAMHPYNPVSGHILPVLFIFHLGVHLNDVGQTAKGGLDPDEFWRAWARGAEMTMDVFDPAWNVWDWVEKDLEALPGEWNVTAPGQPRCSSLLVVAPEHPLAARRGRRWRTGPRIVAVQAISETAGAHQDDDGQDFVKRHVI